MNLSLTLTGFGRFFWKGGRYVSTAQTSARSGNSLSVDWGWMSVTLNVKRRSFF